MKYWAVCMGAILVMAYALVQPIPSNAKVPEVHDCNLRSDSPPGDRISMNTVLGFADKIAKTVHVEKEVFDCFIANNMPVIADVTIVAEIYEDMERQSVIAKQAEVFTCVKDERTTKVLGCSASVPSTTPVKVGDDCVELTINDPQETNSVAGYKKSTIVKTIEAQKEVFRCVNISFLFKFGSDGTGDGQFRLPAGVAVDSSDRIIVADTDNHRIQVFDSAGSFLFKFGSFGTGDGEFDSPHDVATDSSDRIIVADTDNERIQVFDSSGSFLFKFGTFGTGDGEFDSPQGVAVGNSDSIIVADTGNHRIQVFNIGGGFNFKFGTFGTGDGQFSRPNSVAADSSGRIIVADRANSRIQVFDSSGGFLFRFGSFGSGEGQLWTPHGVAVDSSDGIIVADTGNGRIQLFDSAGNFLSKSGSFGFGDGQFNSLAGVAVDSSDRIIAVDADSRIQVFEQTKKKVDLVIFAEIWENLELLPSNPVLKKTFEEFRCVIDERTATVEFCGFLNIP